VKVVTRVEVTLEAVVVDAAKVVRAVAAVDAVKEAVPAAQAVVQVDRAAASVNISAKRKFVSSVSRRWI
jgi:hypothetical protein